MLLKQLKASLFLLIGLSMTACAAAPSDPVLPAPPVVFTAIVNPADAIVVPDYSIPFQVIAADALDNLPTQSPLRVMVADYKHMRDAVRAAQGQK